MAEKEAPGENFEARKRWWQVRASFAVDLPSAQLHHSREGTSIGRRNMSIKRNRMTSIGSDLRRRRSVSVSQMEGNVIHEDENQGLEIDMNEEEEVDEIDQLKQIGMIREMPVPLHEKREMRANLMKNMPKRDDAGFAGWLYRRKVKAYLSQKKGKRQWREVWQYLILWRTALNNIEGNQGSSVLTYFTFLRWLFIMNIIIFLTIFIFLVIPVVVFQHQDYNPWVIGNISALHEAKSCSKSYVDNINISMLPKDLVLDFIQGTGWMENKTMFYGSYPNKLVKITDDYGYNIPLAYLLVTVVYLLFSLILIVGKTSVGFRERLLSGTKAGSQFCNLMFAVWDFNSNKEDTAKLRYMTIYRWITGELRERERLWKVKLRTTRDKARLYTIRFFINFLIIASLCGAGYLIYFIYNKSVEIQLDSTKYDYESYHVFVKLLVQYLTSITLTVLNAILPTIFIMVVRLEHYSPSGAVSITLFRTVFLRLASVAVVFVSINLSRDCKEKDGNGNEMMKDECGVSTGECPTIRCWETKVGQELYKLMLFDFFILIGKTFCVELPRWLVVTKCSHKLAKKIPQQEFDISKEVLTLIYGQTLLWLGTFFAPLIPVIAVLKGFIGFYVKYLASMVFYGPPSKAHTASYSDAFFMKVLLVAYVLSAVPIGYSVWQIAPSRSCGPFRLYESMYDILEINLCKYPQLVQYMLSLLQSSTFEFMAVIILCVVIFYMAQVIRAYKGNTLVLKEQLVMESHDKKYLLEKMQEMATAEPLKRGPYGNKAKTTPQASPMKTAQLAIQNLKLA